MRRSPDRSLLSRPGLGYAAFHLAVIEENAARLVARSWHGLSVSARTLQGLTLSPSVPYEQWRREISLVYGHGRLIAAYLQTVEMAKLRATAKMWKEPISMEAQHRHQLLKVEIERVSFLRASPFPWA